MDPTQLTIIIISFALALLFIILGIQVWYILKEMRISLQKVNKMLDDAGKVSGGRRLMDESMAEFFTGLHVQDAIGGFYENEQDAAKRAFGARMNEAVKKWRIC